MRCEAGIRLAALVSFAWCVSCRPTLDDRLWLVPRPQIIGLKAAPPEARPGMAVTFEVVALDPAGPADTSPTTWAFCSVPKPPAEANVVAPACLTPATPDATGNPVALMIPTDACALFGPDPPQPSPGAPPTRPRDPDATGGYYQPLTIALAGSLAVGLERVTCDLPAASLSVARQFLATYRPNQNPTIAGLQFLVEGTDVDPGAIPAGADVTLELSWSGGSAETFALFDQRSASVVEAQEDLTTSWYVTGGTLDRAATATSDPAVLSATAIWTAPRASGTVQLAVLLRDSRGGMDVAEATLGVTGP